jgi:hypothetical protein
VSTRQFIALSLAKTLNLVGYMTGGATRWRSWLRHRTLQARKSRVPFPMSLEFFVDLILPAALSSWVDSASNRNEYQAYFQRSKGGQCVGLTILPIVWKSGSLSLLTPQGPYTHCFTLYMMGKILCNSASSTLVVERKTNITKATWLIFIWPELTPPRTATSN